MPSSLSQKINHLSAQQRTSDEQIDDFDLLDQEAKRQIILKRRRLFSHYRQYEQWRKKQFSYDSYHYRPLVSAAATKRRRLYRRQYSCVERSEGSRDSHDSKHGVEGTTPSKGNSSKSNSDSFEMPAHHQPSLGRCVALCAQDKNQFSGGGFWSRQPLHLSKFDSADCGALTYQPLHYNSRHFHLLQEEPSTSIAERCTRSRINSAIFVSSEGRGFDSIEFLRRHGSQSVLCRKARSAENITDNERKKSFSENRQWCTDDGSHHTRGREAIELNDVGGAAGARNTDGDHEIAVPCNSMAPHSATAVTTANVIVGSISIEAPPSHLKDDITVLKQQSQDDSATGESGEEYKQSVTTVTRPRKLVHQRSSTTSTNHSQSSPGGSPHHSTKNLSLRNVKQRIVALPMVSVSGPSPPHEKDYL